MVIRSFDFETTDDEVVASLRRHAAEYRAKRRTITVAMILVAAGVLASFAFDRLGLTPPGWSQLVEFMPWFLVFVGGAAMMAKERLQESVKRASSLSDKRLVAPITELLDSEQETERVLAYQAIRRLLPLFNEEDFTRLSHDQRQRLLKSIRKSRDADFVASVLALVKKYGNRDCIAPLEDFIKNRSAVRKGERAWSGSLAHMALADIRMRVARTQIDNATATPDNVVMQDRMKTSGP
jgi:hypothetical protein